EASPHVASRQSAAHIRDQLVRMHPESQFHCVRISLLEHHLFANTLEGISHLLVIALDHGLQVPGPNLASKLVARAELGLLAVFLQVDGRNQLRNEPLADDPQAADEIQVGIS
ncbi:MAG: hypothetical protein ACK559_13910, partial [bacterium]